MNSDRGAWQRPLDFAREEEWSRRAKLFRTERTDPALTDQPALDMSPEDALMELIVSPNNLNRAWRQVKENRGAPGPDGMTIAEFEVSVGASKWATRGRFKIRRGMNVH
jgi:RNA-directed DNA polymerase